MQVHKFNGSYTGEHLRHVEFPLGGIGSGMVCLEGTGGFSSISLRHHPEIFSNKKIFFAAIAIKGDSQTARVLEGPVPDWRIFGPTSKTDPETGGGGRIGSNGFPHFETAEFLARFPFATVSLSQENFPLGVEVTGWSPFIPGEADNSSLPVAAVEYCFSNTTQETIEAVFSFHSENVMVIYGLPFHENITIANVEASRGVSRSNNGFRLWQDGTPENPWIQGAFSVEVDSDAAVDCHWFRGGWNDSVAMLWHNIASCKTVEKPPVEEGKPSDGGSIYVPLKVKPGEKKTVKLRLCWYVPFSDLRFGPEEESAECGENCCCNNKTDADNLLKYRPWYAGRFSDISEVESFWKLNFDNLHEKSKVLCETFYDTTLPLEIVEAVAANLSILKSPTVLRQDDGRLWCFEGCCNCDGCCHGSCTHVWNYAQAIAHLFPGLERTLRETEFNECQDDTGHQGFRAPLPIRTLSNHSFHAAADGQLGGIMKMYRDWRISGDTDWLKKLWPKVRQSLIYCIEIWDPKHKGVIEEPHHNTYDIEFWGADGLCTGFYRGALIAATRIAEALNDDPEPFKTLAECSGKQLENDLYNGEYFYQKIYWNELQSDPQTVAKQSFVGEYSSEAFELLNREGPKYQYGTGCLSDGILGAWIAQMSGLGNILDSEKIKSHLLAVYKYNMKHDLSNHANPHRPCYALGKDGGLVLCSWPNGGELSLPFPYAHEVWTGFEYDVASHLILMGCVDEALDIVRTARKRHDGRVRNPFDEFECGHYYGRTLSSYGLLQSMTGARYDAVEKVLYLKPQIKGDFKSFFSFEGGFGTVGVRNGEPFIDVEMGSIKVERIEYIINV